MYAKGIVIIFIIGFNTSLHRLSIASRVRWSVLFSCVHEVRSSYFLPTVFFLVDQIA